MNDSRRSFIKKLSGLFAGLTVEGRLRAREAEKAANYISNYRRVSHRTIIEQKPYLGISGSYLTGLGKLTITGSWHACSGVFFASTGMFVNPVLQAQSGYINLSNYE